MKWTFPNFWLHVFHKKLRIDFGRLLKPNSQLQIFYEPLLINDHGWMFVSSGQLKAIFRGQHVYDPITAKVNTNNPGFNSLPTTENKIDVIFRLFVHSKSQFFLFLSKGFRLLRLGFNSFSLFLLKITCACLSNSGSSKFRDLISKYEVHFLIWNDAAVVLEVRTDGRKMFYT